MYIGKVSKLSGASRKAIHHYEKIGLLQGVIRSGTYRTYNEYHVVIISMIKRSQALGFSLSEIEPLVLAKTERRFAFNTAISAIDRKRAKIKLEIKRAKKIDLELVSLKRDLKVECETT
jgi:MerR family copper efflux transcriptional regulator